MVSIAVALMMGADLTPIRLVEEYSRQELPFERINGISITSSKWVVGGMRGLSIGSPGSKWKSISDQAVRQLISTKRATWALYGNGSVDKLDVASDQLYYDVFHGAVKRPWAGSMSFVGETLCFGGSGGWFEKTGAKSVTETYPIELKGKNVTCVESNGPEKVVGTQDGLFISSGKQTKRLGFGDGLSDVWITSLARIGGSVVVGTYTGGLYTYTGGVLKKIDAPSQKVRSLLVWHNHLVLGTLEGTWVKTEQNWQNLMKGETTFVAPVDGQLAVGTPASVTIFK